MIVIASLGGLGNQMFQYAFYLSLKQINNMVKFDISYFKNDIKCHNGFELEDIFDIRIDYSTDNENILAGKPGKVISFFMNRNILLDIVKRFYKNYYISDAKDAITYIPTFRKKEKGYLVGFWQSEKYFKNIENLLKNDFKFKKALDEKNIRLMDMIKDTNSVSIHVRRGDYLSIENKNFQNVCTLIYYKNAIKYIEKYVNNPFYYIFSNDIEWCRMNLNLKNATYVDWNVGEDSYKDMQMMSYCKHNIIANSTFSWWGAWLNGNPNKIVCVPEKWFDLPGCETKDVCPDEWVRIKIK